MEKNQARYVYLVFDLKERFQKALSQGVQELRAEPLPKGSQCLSDSCPAQEKVIGLTKSLKLLSDHFKDSDYVALKSIPSELVNKEGSVRVDPSAIPFYAQYARFDCLKVTNQEVQADPALCYSHGQANLTL